MLAVAAVPAQAATAYGEAFDTLYRIDLDKHEATRVGAAGRHAGQLIGNISGLAPQDDGVMYAVAGALKLLIALDTSTGEARIVGDLGLSGQGDPNHNDALDLNMTASCDGTLWLVSAIADKLWTVDPANGSATLVGPTGHTITGLVARGGTLYGAGGKGDNTFYRIDRETGAATAIGSFGPELQRWVNSISMSFDETGRLWAVINYVPPEHDNDAIADWSDLATIDPDTGVVHIVGPITGPESLRKVGIKGFTTGAGPCAAGAAPAAAPVGTPLALGVLALLLVAAATLHRRRQPA
ncbi:hypothetical protein [Dokdonella fugitiva]|jgi:MYXO-CTERM domain-containing protein|nr:hypothetical protein [Dokdonella fugitiva]MBA8885145.1 MYXO-CTERM domain-containing protein [Dokdonella fugitiva]